MVLALNGTFDYIGPFLQRKVVVVVVLSLSRVRLFATPRTAARQAPLSMGFPGKSTGVGCQALLQGIFPSQGSNPHLLLGRQTPYQQATWEALYQDAPHKRE